jgi:hypothetical protein
MERELSDHENEGSASGRRASDGRPMLAGVEVREEDLEPQKGLHFVAMVFRVSSVVILLLALWQFADWWLDPPPGGAGMAVLVSDTIRLIVVSALLWAAGNLADLLIKSHYDIRAGRILLARTAHMIQQMGIANGTLPPPKGDADRRSHAAESTTPPGPRTPPAR